jgi:SAM-dependent methyltransferase
LVVEIGCGAGGILQAFADAGYRVIGADLGAENLAYGRSRGLDLRNGDLFSLVEEIDEKPALIIYSHVLEHIREPGRTLERVRQTLAEDGHLYVEVPGVKDVRSNVFQGDFLKTFHLAHIYNFSLLTLTNLAGKHGFSLVAGDEKIRSVFKRAEMRADLDGYESDYQTELAYMLKTERWRSFYRRRFAAKMALQTVLDTMRSTTVGVLRRAGMYDFAKRVVLRS